jgi:hypothetical protein
MTSSRLARALRAFIASGASMLTPLVALSQSDLPPIMDNSFLIEEAYNQEPGVVQHAMTFVQTRGVDGWLATFTQEWPVRSQKHQLSFTIPYQYDGFAGGLGDVAIHYRRQLRELRPQLSISPRLSLILPTGSVDEGRGKGSPGVEVALPVSYILNERFFGHTNGGLRLTPAAQAPNGASDPIMENFIGQSLVFLAHPRLNFLAEIAWDTEETLVDAGVTVRTESFFFSPGIRGAFNFASGMQIVPGIAVPIGLGPSSGDRAVFVYLSVEHAFSR